MQLYRGHTTPTGEPAPKRLKPIFRDRDELPASADLGREVENALSTSRYLIIVCSPQATKSQWVQKEIETFRALGRQDRILALVVDGQPNAGDELECFPPALRQAEPLAADAGPDGDGRTNAKLKLMAAMLGIGFDALKMRDAQRRVRRLWFTVIATLLLTLGFSGLAWYANYERKQAERTRDQARSTLRYVLTDLRNNLIPIGRIDILEQVQRRADEYYHQFDARLPRTATENEASSRINKGEIAVRQGRNQEALSTYRAALSVLQDLVKQQPLDLDRQYELVECHGKIGQVLCAQDDLTGAMKAFQTGLIIAERLVAMASTDASLHHLLCLSFTDVGNIYRLQGDLDSALTVMRRARDEGKALVESDSSNALWTNDLANSSINFGDVLLARNDYLGARIEFFRALHLNERLAQADSANNPLKHDVAVALMRIGDSYLADSSTATMSLLYYSDCIKIYSNLVKIDSTNVDWLNHLLQSYENLVDLFLRSETLNPNLALAASMGCLYPARRLVELDPDNPVPIRKLWSYCYVTGRLLEEQGDPGSNQIYKTALGILEDIRKQGVHLSDQDEAILEELTKRNGY